MSNYRENENNIESEKKFASWQLDESKLSESDKIVLEMVNFPKSIEGHKCVGKRIAKFESNDTWHYKKTLDLDDFKYLNFTKKIAWVKINELIPEGNTPDQLKADAEYKEKGQRSKPYKQVYIDAHYIEQELEWLLTNFSAPKATPSMEAIVSETPNIEEKKAEPKKKGGKPKATLNDREKVKAKHMSLDGKTAKEIAADLGKPKVTVVNYLKELKAKS